MVQLREELLRARQTHGGELDGVRKEVSRLTAELHRRDRAIASMEAEQVKLNTGQPSCDPGCCLFLLKKRNSGVRPFKNDLMNY